MDVVVDLFVYAVAGALGVVVVTLLALLVVLDSLPDVTGQSDSGCNDEEIKIQSK